jgi:hypothetical protein
MGGRYSGKARAEHAMELAAARAVIENLAERLAAVGSNPDARLLWLGEFVTRDLSDEHKHTAAAGELDAFLTHHFRSWGSDFRFAGSIYHGIEPAEVPAIQAALRDVLNQLGSEDYVWFSQPIGDGLRWRVGRGVALVTRAGGLPQVLAAVADLLMAVGPRLGRCKTPSCRSLFASKRPGQVHCTTKCGGTFRVNEWRKKNRERVAESRHGPYARKVKAKLPGVRVSRRRPKER